MIDTYIKEYINTISYKLIIYQYIYCFLLCTTFKIYMTKCNILRRVFEIIRTILMRQKTMLLVF